MDELTTTPPCLHPNAAGMGSTQHPLQDPKRVKAGDDQLLFDLEYNPPPKVLKFYPRPFAMRFKLDLSLSSSFPSR